MENENHVLNYVSNYISISNQCNFCLIPQVSSEDFKCESLK